MTAVNLVVRTPKKLEPIWKTQPRYVCLHGGRGGSKSHTIADRLVVRGYQERIRWLCAREIQKSLAASSLQLLKDKIEARGLGAHYTVTKEGIVGANGTQFLFAGLRTNPDSVKSMEGLDGAWVEEADRCSQTSLDLLTPTVRKPGSQVYFSFNRSSLKSPVDVMFLQGAPPPGSFVQQVNWRDNPWFPDELRAEMEWMKARDPDKWLHVWEGHPLSRSEAKVFSGLWEIDDLDEEAAASASEWRYGADWGFATDPTVLLRCKIMGRKLYISHEAYRVRCEIDDTPALFAGDDPRTWVDEADRWKNPHRHPGVEGAFRGLITADSARPETISYMDRRGFTIRRAIKGAQSVEEGVEFVKTHDIVVHPRCTHVIDELATYSYKVDKLTDEVLPELADRDNHTIDALRYAVESERRAPRGRFAIAGVQTIALGE